MNLLTELLASSAGAILVFVGLADIWRTLFRPTQSGQLSRPLSRLSWKLCHRFAAHRRAALAVAGPATFLAIVASWLALLVLGFALIYWPQLPEGFLRAEGLGPPSDSSFVTALYLSMVTISTLGFGDIVPTEGWLRIVVPLQSLLGFVVLSATISWLLSIYPALLRRRVLSAKAALLVQAAEIAQAHPERLGDILDPTTLTTLTDQVAAIETDLLHFPITYYFWTEGDEDSFAAVVAGLTALVQVPPSTLSPLLASHLEMLKDAFCSWRDLVSREFLGGIDDPTAFLMAWSEDRRAKLGTGPEL